MEVQEIVEQYRRFHPKRPTESITDAYRLAAGSHKGQLRRSGEPYITHPLAVAGIVARYGMDDVTIAAALLHDAVEDTVLTLEEVEAAFGSEVRDIVDGVTKLTTETGAGQWGSALAFAGAQFGIDVEVWQVRASYDSKPYRGYLMRTYGATVHPSPSTLTESTGSRLLSRYQMMPSAIAMLIRTKRNVSPTRPTIDNGCRINVNGATAPAN